MDVHLRLAADRAFSAQAPCTPCIRIHGVQVCANMVVGAAEPASNVIASTDRWAVPVAIRRTTEIPAVQSAPEVYAGLIQNRFRVRLRKIFVIAPQDVAQFYAVVFGHGSAGRPVRHGHAHFRGHIDLVNKAKRKLVTRRFLLVRLAERIGKLAILRYEIVTQFFLVALIHQRRKLRKLPALFGLTWT